MRLDTHKARIEEVKDEIRAALGDGRGIVLHQSRLASMISLGSVNLIEMFLHRSNSLSIDRKLDHRLFKKKTKKMQLKSFLE